MIRPYLFTISAFLTLALCDVPHVFPAEARSTDKTKGKVAVFEVPTTGSILDVSYSPEFEEWWVKCREGDSIVVYTMGKSSKTWGKAVFEPQKSARKTDKPPASVKPGVEPQPEAAEAVPKEPAPPEAIPVRPEPRKEEPAGEKKKWWDPLQLLKKL